MKLSMVDSEIEKIVDKHIDSLNTNITKEDLKSMIEPNSLDLPIGNYAYEIDSPYMPNNKTVLESLKNRTNRLIDVDSGVHLHKESNYLSPLIKISGDTSNFYVQFSPKSSVGRTFLHSRTIADNFGQHDVLSEGYNGEVWNLISPKAFNTYINPIALSQARFIPKPEDNYTKLLSNIKSLKDVGIPTNQILEYIEFQLETPKLNSQDFFKNINGEGIEKRLFDNNKFQISISTKDFEIAGYESLNTNKYVDMTKIKSNKASDFFSPIKKADKIKLQKGKYYIAATKELFSIPPEYCVEIMPSDHTSGEYRLHFAGFVDSNFGYTHGNTLVLEIYAHEDCEVEDGQMVGWAEIYKNTKTPSKLYGDKNTSNYVRQTTPKLSKYFIDDINRLFENK